MSEPLDILELAIRAKRDAAAVVERHTNPGQKKASLTLYGIMASCLELCERCDRDPNDLQQLSKLFGEQPKTGNRRYVEKGSDIYVLVCRYVFSETDRTNAIRYASALREAGKMQIASTDLRDWMKKNGGINALYFRRPLDARTVKTKCLRLAEQIEVDRDKPFTLTLAWRDDNTFSIIQQKEE